MNECITGVKKVNILNLELKIYQGADHGVLIQP